MAALYLRGKIWWMKHSYFGRVLRESTGTPNISLAERVAAERRRMLDEARIADRAKGRKYKKHNRSGVVPANYARDGKWSAMVTAFGGACAYCRRPFHKDEIITKDHVVPVSKGGVDGNSNCVPACMSCNTRRGNEPVQKWMRRAGYSWDVFTRTRDEAHRSSGICEVTI